jgi:glycogen debranching enzyme
MPVRSPTRTIPAPVVKIIPATDLGSVEVAKRGNRYLLTDHWGDIRIDGRGLGLYDLDTRILSTSILRLNGSALTLLRGPHTDDGADTIQLTNPELRRNPADKRTVESSLARRDLSVTRLRVIEDGDLHERVTVVNYSGTPEDLDLELGLGVDMADIFEVRGYKRPARGTLLPIELRDDRVVFGYEGLDGLLRRTAVITGDARLEPVTDHEGWVGARVTAHWTAHLEAGARMTVG